MKRIIRLLSFTNLLLVTKTNIYSIGAKKKILFRKHLLRFISVFSPHYIVHTKYKLILPIPRSSCTWNETMNLLTLTKIVLYSNWNHDENLWFRLLYKTILVRVRRFIVSFHLQEDHSVSSIDLYLLCKI